MQIRLRLVWNKNRHRDRHARALTGLIRAVEEETTKGHFRTIWVDAPKLLKLLTVAGVLAWFALAAGLYVWLWRNPYNRVGYADLAFPWRWSHLKERRGEGYIEAGLTEIRARRWQEGLYALRQGLARHPDAPEARMAAAGLYARAGYYQGVRDVLLPQLDYTLPSRAYLEQLLKVASVNDDHATILTACERVLARKDVPANERGWLLEQKAAALLALGRAPEVLPALEAAGRERSLEWRRLYVSALADIGRADDALKEVRSWGAGIPAPFRLQMLVSVCRRAGRFDEMKAALDELQRTAPANPETWAIIIGTYERAGWRDAAWNTLQESIRRFGANTRAMESIERVCAEVEAEDLLQLCLENARELGHSPLPTLLDLAVVQLRRGEQARAAQTYDALIEADRETREAAKKMPLETGPTVSPLLPPAGFAARAGLTWAADAAHPITLPPAVRDWLHTLIEALALPPGDPSAAHVAVLQGKPIPPTLFARSEYVLAANGHWPAVAAVATVGLVKFPGSTILTRWSRDAATKIAAMPKSPPAAPVVLAVAGTPVRRENAGTASAPSPAVDYRTISQENFFATLDQAEHRKAWAEQEAAIRSVLAARPAWLPKVEAELVWLEVRSELEQAEPLRATLTMSERLRVHPLEAPRALTLAREWQSRKDLETARRLTETIVAAVPEFKPGRAYLQELKQLQKTPEVRQDGASH